MNTIEMIVKLISLVVAFWNWAGTDHDYISWCVCGHKKDDHYWGMDMKGCDPEPRTAAPHCFCNGFVDRYAEVRVRLDEAAERVRNMQVGPPPQPGGVWIDNTFVLEVPNDGWLPEKIIHISSVGRAVKLPKKDE